MAAQREITSETIIKAFTRLRDVYPPLSLNQAIALFWVGENPGANQRSLFEYLGLSDSAASKIVSVLMDGSRKGLGLIEVVIDPADRRHRRLALTSKGRRLIKDVIADIGGR